MRADRERWSPESSPIRWSGIKSTSMGLNSEPPSLTLAVLGEVPVVSLLGFKEMDFYCLREVNDGEENRQTFFTGAVRS